MFKLGVKKLLKKREESEYKYPLVFTPEGQEYLGVKVATIKAKSFRCDYYYHEVKNRIQCVEYIEGVRGQFLKLGYNAIGYLLYVINVLDLREKGLDILEDVASISKKYIYVGSTFSLPTRNTEDITKFEEVISNYLKRSGKEKYISKLKMIK